MAITAFVIHRIHRLQDEEPATLTLGQDTGHAGADHEFLLSQMKKLFNAKPGKKYGRFSSEVGDHPFSRWLSEALNEKIPFARCSNDFMQLLKQHIDASRATLDGYVVMVNDQRAEDRRIYLFWLENESGLQITRTLELDTCDYLNIGRLEIAARVELNDWLGEHPGDSYLTLLASRNQSELSDLFARTLGFQSSVDTEKETQTLLETLEQFATKVEPKTASQVYKKAYDFCADQHARGEAVQIKELSGVLNEQEPGQFARFAHQEMAIDGEAEFFPDHRKIKQLIRFAGKGKGLSLSFNSDLMTNAVHYDPQKDVLTITDIPKGLKQQLVRFIKSVEKPQDHH